MANIQTLISGPGPLPLTANFNTDGDGDVVIFISGSAWSQTEGSMLQVNLVIDGNTVGAAAVYTNESASHKALVPVIISTTLTYGPHTVELVANPGNTVSDYNDNFQVVLMY